MRFVQAAVFAHFTGDRDRLEFCREQYTQVLLPAQMATDGSFPQELARTKPYGYSIFVLDNLSVLCQVLSDAGSNLSDFTLDDGRSIRQGLDFFVPYLQNKAAWPFARDIQHFEAWPVQIPSLLFAGIALERPDYIELWSRLDPDPANREVRRNIAIRQPLLWL